MVERVKGREKEKKCGVCVKMRFCQVSAPCPWLSVLLYNYLAPPRLRSGHLLYRHIAELYEECTTKHRTDGGHSGKVPPVGCRHDVVRRSFQDGRRIGGGVSE